MNELESQLHYPFGDTLPAAGTTIEVAPGVRWAYSVSCGWIGMAALV